MCVYAQKTQDLTKIQTPINMPYIFMGVEKLKDIIYKE